MTTTTQWADLPNAAHIDRVLASAIANPDHWTAREGEGWAVAWNATRDLLKEQGRYSMWLARQQRGGGWGRMRRTTWSAMREALLALVAYDDCAYMLDSDPGELAILAAFGDPRAILLLSACKAFHSCKELV